MKKLALPISHIGNTLIFCGCFCEWNFTSLGRKFDRYQGLQVACDGLWAIWFVKMSARAKYNLV